MATNLDQIADYLRNNKLHFRREDEKNWIVIPYEHKELNPMIVVVALEEEGRFLKIFTPNLFKYVEGTYKLLLMQTMLLTSWETKMLQWEYDPIDGEIRAMVEFPIEDATLTEKQFKRALDALVQLVVICYPRLKSVIETGADPGREGKDTASDQLARDFMDFIQKRDKGGAFPPDDGPGPGPGPGDFGGFGGSGSGDSGSGEEGGPPPVDGAPDEL